MIATPILKITNRYNRSKSRKLPCATHFSEKPMDSSFDGLSLPALILFDFDGTLADSYPAITASVNHTRLAHGLSPLETNLVKRFVGRGPEYLLGNTVPGVDFQEAFALYKAHHPTVLASGTVLLPGVREMLVHLVSKGVLLGICSNKPREFTQLLVGYLNLNGFFSWILGPEDVANRKPAPDMLLEAVKRSNLAKAQVLYVGDMSVDVQTAQAAGISVWAVATGSETAEEILAAGPDRIFGSMEILHQALCSQGFGSTIS